MLNIVELYISFCQFFFFAILKCHFLTVMTSLAQRRLSHRLNQQQLVSWSNLLFLIGSSLN